MPEAAAASHSFRATGSRAGPMSSVCCASLQCMAKLVYLTIASLDGYTADEDGRFDWGAPDDEVHGFINERERSTGTYLYGRRMYETMVFWETATATAADSAETREFAEIWRAAEKIVYSTTLTEPSSARTRIEPTFDPAAVAELKANSSDPLGIGGPEIASHALKAGLVDEYHCYVAPVIVGGGKRALPNGFEATLELLEERRFTNGFVFLRYAIR